MNVTRLLPRDKSTFAAARQGGLRAHLRASAVSTVPCPGIQRLTNDLHFQPSSSYSSSFTTTQGPRKLSRVQLTEPPDNLKLERSAAKPVIYRSLLMKSLDHGPDAELQADLPHLWLVTTAESTRLAVPYSYSHQPQLASSSATRESGCAIACRAILLVFSPK
jgi:hypothetical protein